MRLRCDPRGHSVFTFERRTVMMPITPISPLIVVVPVLYIAFLVFLLWAVVSVVKSLKRIATAAEIVAGHAQVSGEKGHTSS